MGVHRSDLVHAGLSTAGMPPYAKAYLAHGHNMLQVRTDDIREAQILLSEHLGDCRIQSQVTGPHFGVEFQFMEFERAAQFRWHNAGGAEGDFRFKRNVVCQCTQGRAFLDMPDGTLTIEGDHAAILPQSELCHIRWSADTTFVGVAISEVDFRREALAILQSGMSERLGIARGFDMSSSAGRKLQDVLQMLREDLDSSDATDENKPVRLMFDRLIVYSLIRILGHDAAAGSGSRSSLAPRHIKRAEGYIKAHLAEPLNNLLLARVAEVSPRSLYRGFIHFRGMTPARYVQELRLDEAHKMLMSTEAREDIKIIAAKAGFRSYAAFWRSYVRKFGSPPSKSRARRTGAPEEGTDDR